MAYSIPGNDEYFLKLLNDGILDVSEDGLIVKDLKRDKTLNQTFTSNYARVQCYGKGIQVNRLVHLKYIGPIPNKRVVDHRDGNKLNNHYSNLEAITESENNKRAHRLGLKPLTESQRESRRYKGIENPLSKLSIKQIKELRKLWNNKEITKKEAIVKYEITRKTVENIISGRSHNYPEYYPDNP